MEFEFDATALAVGLVIGYLLAWIRWGK